VQDLRDFIKSHITPTFTVKGPIIYFEEICMKEIKVIVKNKVGLHARPAALFVQTAAKFKSEIKVSCLDKDANKPRIANAKSILSILTLGVFEGTEITIQATGEDEDKAAQALVDLVVSNFGETK
jgi:phosphocarrier protein HPr